MSVHLSSVGIFGGVVVSSHAQYIFSTVIELREAVELAVGEVDGRLVDSIQWCVGVVGAVEEWLEQQMAAVEVSSASQVNSLVLRTHLILEVSWQTGFEDGRVCALSLMLTQQPRDSSDRWELTKEFWLTSNIDNINKSVKTKEFYIMVLFKLHDNRVAKLYLLVQTAWMNWLQSDVGVTTLCSWKLAQVIVN